MWISSQPHWRRASSSSADTPSRRDGVSTRSNAGRSHRISTCTWTRRLAGAVAAASITVVGTDTTAGATAGATAGSVAGADTGAMACVVVGEVAGAVAGEVARAVAAVVSGCILVGGARRWQPHTGSRKRVVAAASDQRPAGHYPPADTRPAMTTHTGSDTLVCGPCGLGEATVVRMSQWGRISAVQQTPPGKGSLQYHGIGFA